MEALPEGPIFWFYWKTPISYPVNGHLLHRVLLLCKSKSTGEVSLRLPVTVVDFPLRKRLSATFSEKCFPGFLLQSRGLQCLLSLQNYDEVDEVDAVARSRQLEPNSEILQLFLPKFFMYYEIKGFYWVIPLCLLFLEKMVSPSPSLSPLKFLGDSVQFYWTVLFPVLVHVLWLIVVLCCPCYLLNFLISFLMFGFWA